MPEKKTEKGERKKFLMDLYHFIEWTNQLTFLVFFTAILLFAVLLMNLYILTLINPSFQNNYSVQALIIALIAFGVILMFSLQQKRLSFEKQLKKDM
jgi:putative copper export protein